MTSPEHMTCPRNTNRPGTWDPNYLNFGPRVGLAYTLKNNTGSGLINLLFLGTRQQIDDAFQAGGWSAAERKSPLSLSMYNALTRRIGTVRLNQHAIY